VKELLLEQPILRRRERGGWWPDLSPGSDGGERFRRHVFPVERDQVDVVCELD
jgi:hypothetical protein